MKKRSKQIESFREKSPRLEGFLEYGLLNVASEHPDGTLPEVCTFGREQAVILFESRRLTEFVKERVRICRK